MLFIVDLSPPRWFYFLFTKAVVARLRREAPRICELILLLLAPVTFISQTLFATLVFLQHDRARTLEIPRFLHREGI